MNRTFKVVFNKARGALMVANEATSSVQKKGNKLLVAFVAAATLCSGAFAAETISMTTGQTIERTDAESYEFKKVLSEKEGSKVVIGSEITNQITINNSVNNGQAYGLYARSGGVVEVDGKNLTINVSSEGVNGYTGAIWAQNNTDLETAPDNTARVVINAENTVIRAESDRAMGENGNTWVRSIGIAAMSNGYVEINGNVDIEAEDVLLTRGYAVTKINASADPSKVIKLKGDIDFNYNESTSGTTVDANVYINLANAESFWTGRVLASNDNSGEIALPSEDPNYAIGTKADGLVLGLSNGGTWNVTGKSLVNQLNMTGGGVVNVQNEGTTIYVDKLTISGVGNQLFAEGSTISVTNGGFINFENGSELVTTLNSVYAPTFTEDVLTGATGKLDGESIQIVDADGVVDADGSAMLTLTDNFIYSMDGLEALAGVYDGLQLNLANATLAEGETASLVGQFIQTNEQVSETVVAGGAGGPASLDLTDKSNSGAQSLVVKQEGAEAVDSVKLTGSTTLTLVGAAEQINLVENSNGQAVDVTVDSGMTLNLGLNSEETTQGKLASVAVADGGTMNISNIAVQMDELTVGDRTGAHVSIGSAEKRGDVKTQKLTIAAGSTVFMDPIWQDGARIDDASHLAAVESVIDGNLVVGQNSLASLGTATADPAVAAFNQLTKANPSLAWGEGNVTAALYVNKTLAVGAKGKVVVDGSLDELPTNLTDYAAQVNIAASGMLIADVASLGTDVVVDGSLALADGSYVGLLNADEGVYQLASGTVTANADQVTVVTDNPFVSAALGTGEQGGSLVATYDGVNGLKALSSLGLQAMTRRADSVLSNTIADRTSFGQNLKPGINLWVDVAGENYKSDDFDKGGEFEADMGYGTFGGDVAIGAFTVGGALQYGTGSLRSSVSGIKNSIDNYGVSLYGTYNVTDAFKIGAELAYVWGENDITSNQTALNQSVDTEMYSLGLRAVYEMTAGAFRFVPSIGLRVSQLSTDEMRVGSVKIDDQDQTLVQVPIAMRITAADFATASGWMLSPSFKLAYVPTFGDKDIEALHMSEDVIDTSPVQADFGLLAGKDNMLFNVNFMLGAGENGTSAVGGKVGFKYAF